MGFYFNNLTGTNGGCGDEAKDKGPLKVGNQEASSIPPGFKLKNLTLKASESSKKDRIDVSSVVGVASRRSQYREFANFVNAAGFKFQGGMGAINAVFMEASSKPMNPNVDDACDELEEEISKELDDLAIESKNLTWKEAKRACNLGKCLDLSSSAEIDMIWALAKNGKSGKSKKKSDSRGSKRGRKKEKEKD